MVRLTTAVDNLSDRLSTLHDDIRLKDEEVFMRLRMIEAKVARLEGLAKAP